MNRFAIFDIDETLTLFRQEKQDLLPTDGIFNRQTMQAWRDECANDVANMRMVELYHYYASLGYTMVLLTARGGDARYITEAWLRAHGITPHMLIMRTVGEDMHGTVDYKVNAVRAYLDDAWHRIEVMVDDHLGVCDAFATRGVLTITP